MYTMSEFITKSVEVEKERRAAAEAAALAAQEAEDFRLRQIGNKVEDYLGVVLQGRMQIAKLTPRYGLAGYSASICVNMTLSEWEELSNRDDDENISRWVTFYFDLDDDDRILPRQHKSSYDYPGHGPFVVSGSSQDYDDFGKAIGALMVEAQ